MAQCVGCHLNGAPIGVKAGYLNKSGHGELSGQNQLQYLIKKGRLIIHLMGERGKEEEFQREGQKTLLEEMRKGDTIKANR